MRDHDYETDREERLREAVDVAHEYTVGDLDRGDDRLPADDLLHPRMFKDAA